MMNPAFRPDATLPEVLAARARAASDGRLVADVLGGLALAIVVMLRRPPGWLILLCAGVCFTAFGLWGITDRELRERAASRGSRLLVALGVARVLSTVAGGVAAAVMLVAVLALALGTWIS